jgi:hypothetical protein
VIERVQAEVDIEGGPMKMFLVRELNMQYLSECCIAKLGEVHVRQEILLVSSQDPNAESVDVGDFNLQNARAMPRG